MYQVINNKGEAVYTTSCPFEAVSVARKQGYNIVNQTINGKTKAHRVDAIYKDFENLN